MPRGILFIIACVAVIAVGCSSSSGSDTDRTTTPESTAPEATTTTTTAPEPVPVEEESAYVEALATRLVQGGGESLSPVLDPEQADCFAPEWVAIATPEGLGEAGVTSAELADPNFDLRQAGMDEQEAYEAVNALNTCGVTTQELVGSVFTAEMDEESGACVSASLDPDAVRTLLASAFTQDIDLEKAFQDALLPALAQCEEG